MLLDFLLPKLCLLCQRYAENYFCSQCRLELPQLKPGCYVCGNEGPSLCGRCLASPPYFDRTTAAIKYADPITNLITQFKFNEKLNYLTGLSHLLLEKIKSRPQLPELLIPVPLHKNRIKHRGFNQALLLAKKIGKELNIPVDYSSIKRIKNTTPQSQLPAKQRDKNIRGAFAATQLIPAKHIALVDDVITTGNTVNELARTIKQQQDCYIEVWALART